MPGRGREADTAGEGGRGKRPIERKGSGDRRERGDRQRIRDYQLRVACRDTAELDVLLRTLRMELGAADTETKIVLRSGPPPPR
jgi:hypothetical protein